MELITLIENEAGRRDLKAEHGLSFLLRTDGKNILFDTGSSGAVWDNAKKLGIRPEEIDWLVLSHNHYDHAGGFRRGVREGLSCPVVCGEGFFEAKYRAGGAGVYTYLGGGISREFVENHSAGVTECGEFFRLSEHCCAVGRFKNGGSWEQISKRFAVRGADGFRPDPFGDEICLAAELPGDRGLGVICGCSHPGIVNMLSEIRRRFPGKRLEFVAGGIHLSGAGQEEAGRTVSAIEAMGVGRLYLNHCSGAEALAAAKVPAARLRSGDCLFF